MLPDLGSDPIGELEDHRNSDKLLTKGGRVSEKRQLPDRQIDCPKCGKRKTPGLPCPHCNGAQE